MDRAHRPVIILGAGIAGLAAALALKERGVEALVIEGSSHSQVKTCGEFLSCEALPLLKKWGVTPSVTITHAQFTHKNKTLSHALPHPCASMPRLELERALVQLLGDQVQFGRKVVHIDHKLELQFDDGDILLADQLVISAGRWQGKKATSSPPYRGFKNHFAFPITDNTLRFFFFDGGYVGLSPLNQETSVISCLTKKSHMPSFINEQFAPILDKKVYPEWLTSSIGHFGPQQCPDWPHSYFIGDAAGTVAPLSGGGIAMALLSGNMVADYIINRQWQQFRHDLKQRTKRRIQISRHLHNLALSPLFPHAFSFLPLAWKPLFHLTREAPTESINLGKWAVR